MDKRINGSLDVLNFLQISSDVEGMDAVGMKVMAVHGQNRRGEN